MKTVFFTIFCLTRIAVSAQMGIRGIVLDSKNNPVAGASILMKDENRGVSADSAGRFSLETTRPGKIPLFISALGYHSKELLVDASNSSKPIRIELQDEHKSLGEVVVTAGSFEASDKAKGASLTPMDAVTVAGNGGDIANALRFLPGTQQIGNQEGLFVRGGTGTESKQFVDGVLLPDPNYASVPNLPQPAHLNPFLFGGILFSSGGYSALYGDALSGALILETVGLPDKSSASLHIFPTNVGAGFQELTKDNKNSYGMTANYGNQYLYDLAVPQQPGYFIGPEYFSMDANFRIKTGKTGMLKFYTNYGYSAVGLRNQDIDSMTFLYSFLTKGFDLYSNISYRQPLGKRWKLDAALASNINDQKITTALLGSTQQTVFIADTPYDAKNSSSTFRSRFAQARGVLTRSFSQRQAIRFGAEYFYDPEKEQYNAYNFSLNNNLLAAFAEGDIYITPNIAAKAGIRYEYAALLRKQDLSPRISAAFRFEDGGQVNLAYGIFNERPDLTYLFEDPKLDFTRATHYIVNYQKKANNRLLRIEAYYKSYAHLVMTEPSLNNSGTGYAKGVELFFRDKKTFKNIDYWITYTYLDTKRQFLNYPSSLRPDFTTPHTASFVIKRFIPDINLSANLSYALATGRTYYDIRNNRQGMPFIAAQGTTRMYNALNSSFAYLFTLFSKRKDKDYSGIGFGVNNLLGTKQIFGYNFSYDGTNKVPIVPSATRSYYIGFFMSLGIDRRDDFINENL